MNKHAELAISNFKEGYNCCQAVFLAFSDECGLDKKAIALLGSGMGGGVARMREVCGAVSGMIMATGCLYGYTEASDYEGKANTYELGQKLAKKFEEETGTIICRDLLGLEGANTDPKPAKRTAKYYAERPCERYVGYAAEILGEYIESNKNK